ncbi:MAG TPA: universal stress protein [Bacteroidia bacterium]|nr:universal stress protein [Bacteroidia bacterium]
MKPLVIAIDYSPAGRNAAEYGVQLAKQLQMPVFLFHSYALPVLSGESVAVPVSPEEIEQSQAEAIRDEAGRLEKKYGVKIATGQSMGFAAEEIGEFAKAHSAGLIVAGMQHPNTAGKILGSVTTALIGEAEFPVLVVPENATFAAPKNILFATDLKTNSEWKELDFLKELNAKQGVQIHIVNAVSKDHVPDQAESIEGIHLENKVKEISHDWYFPENDHLPEAIAETAVKVKAEWIAVVHHRLPVMKQVFHRSSAKKLAFNLTLPMLALPEKHAGILG